MDDNEEYDEIDELDTLDGHYGCEGYPYSEDELKDWLKTQDDKQAKHCQESQGR